ERRLRDVIHEAKGLLLLQSFDAAIDSLNRLQNEFSDSEETRELLDRARKGQDSQRRKQRLQGQTEQAKELLRSQRFQEALALLRALEVEFPEAAELNDLRTYGERELVSHKQADVVARATDEVRALIAITEFDAALDRLQKVLSEYPGAIALR